MGYRALGNPGSATVYTVRTLNGVETNQISLLLKKSSLLASD